MNRPHRSRRFIYFKALFSCKKHQDKILKTQRALVANLATNFSILVTSTIILVALATVLGAISCPDYVPGWLCITSYPVRPHRIIIVKCLVSCQDFMILKHHQPLQQDRCQCRYICLVNIIIIDSVLHHTVFYELNC